MKVWALVFSFLALAVAPVRAADGGAALQLRPATIAELEGLGLRTPGALVVEAAPAGPPPALRKGDVIAFANDKPVTRPGELVEVAEAAQGKPIKLVVYRDSIPEELSITLPGALQDAGGRTLGPPAWLGLIVQRLTAGSAKGQLQLLWMENGSPALGRLQTGDLLLAADGAPLGGIPQLVGLVGAHYAGETVNFKVRRGKQEMTVAVPFGRQPRAEPTVIASGEFRGDAYSGRLYVYLDPNRRTASGSMSGVGKPPPASPAQGVQALGNVLAQVASSGTMEGTFQGSWDPVTGAVQIAFEGSIRSLVRSGIKGAISGQVDRAGRGGGSFVGTGRVGEERGTWQCQPVVSTDVGGA
jgi:hypothetical protein